MKTFLAKLWRTLHLPTDIQLHVMRLVNDELLVGLTGVIFNDKDEILLLKHRYREVVWSLPGGYLKAKEHPKEGLARELLEETGFTVVADKIINVRTDRTTGRLDMSYVGTFIGGDFKTSEEVSEFGFYTLDNLPNILSSQVLLINEAIQKRKSFKIKLRGLSWRTNPQ